MPYDIKDFAAISTVSFSPLVLITHPSLPVNSVKELIALGKAQPGKIDYGSTAIGGSLHLAAELFKARAGVNFVRIPYKGGGDAIAATVAGEVKLMFASGGGVMPQIKGGRVKALVVTSSQPSPLFPGLPTMSESGLPGFQVVGLDGILTTAKTPPAIIKRLNEEMVRALSKPEVKERFFAAGLEVSSSTPQEFAAMIKSETATIGKLIKDANVSTK
jgi:tripartite-type tricarboxylate transporter receptor subunit TctC